MSCLIVALFEYKYLRTLNVPNISTAKNPNVTGVVQRSLVHLVREPEINIAGKPVIGNAL